MRNSAILAALAALFASASAATYYIDNYCPFPMWLESTATPQIGQPPLVNLAANTTNAYSEVVSTCPFVVHTIHCSPQLC